MRTSHKIVFASSNHDKFSEFRHLLKVYPEVELIEAEEVLTNHRKLSLVENHPTFIENAIEKARLANHGCHYPSLADDSGLEVDALNGRPGVKSRRYAIAKAGQSQDEANIQKLLDELRGVPMEKRTAHFTAALAIVIEGLEIHSSGRLDGTIAESPMGNNGFGYDSIFIPKGSSRTLAEMSDTEKNSISHRARALSELMMKIKSKGIVFSKP